jgi:hypothetical protein
MESELRSDGQARGHQWLDNPFASPPAVIELEAQLALEFS